MDASPVIVCEAEIGFGESLRLGLDGTPHELPTARPDPERILTFVFEAFDEPWKGSPDPLEPEKHWGLFYVDRSPKLAMRSVYPELARD